MDSNRPPYRYRAFGLNFASDYPLDELLPADGSPDVYIRKGQIGDSLPDLDGEHAYWVKGHQEFSFRVKGVGSYAIREGREIVAEPCEYADYESFKLYILGSCIGALFLQRNQIPLHGSALVVEDEAIILTGESGAGKSTLTAAMTMQGYGFLTDDIAVLKMEEDGDVMIQPAFPKQKLWRDAAVQLFGSVDSFHRIPGPRDKYHIPSKNLFLPTQRRFHRLFEISVHSKDQVEVISLMGLDKLRAILRNTFRVEMVGEMGIQAEHFRLCSLIASRVSVHQIKRPLSGLTVNDQIRGILNVMRNQKQEQSI